MNEAVDGEYQAFKAKGGSVMSEKNSLANIQNY